MTVIRTETYQDYHAIAQIHALAFTHSTAMSEVPLVDVHRHGSQYDPALSLVAERGGNVIGHVLFTPRQVQVGGALVPAVILSPIAVHPDYQNEGIGGLLIQAGHRRAAEKGYAFSMLLGHPEYYPRFGYRTDMYGSCHFDVARSDIPASAAVGRLSERRVEPADIPLLQAMWQDWFQGVDLAIQSNASMVEWMSTDKGTKAVVVVREQEVVGYVRFHKDRPHQPILFLAVDGQRALQLLAYMNGLVNEEAVETISLPVHPTSSAAHKYLDLPFQARIQPWKAGMIKVLDARNQLIRSYCDEVERGTRPIGLVIWPVEFDVC